MKCDGENLSVLKIQELNLVTRTHVVEGKQSNYFPKLPSYLHMYTMACAHTKRQTNMH